MTSGIPSRPSRPVVRAFYPALIAGLTIIFSSIQITHPPAAHAQERTPLVVGIDRDYPPYAWIDRDGKPRGHGVEFMRLVAQKAGLEIYFRGDTWERTVAALERGEVEAIIGMLYTESRSRVFDFSQPYAMDTAVIFVRRDSAIRDFRGLDGRDMAMLRGDALVESFINNHGLDVRLTYYDTHPGALRALGAGLHDVTIAPYQVGMEAIRRYGLSNLTDRGPAVNTLPYRVAVKKGNTRIGARINDAVDAINLSPASSELRDTWQRYRREEFTWHTILRYLAIVMAPLLVIFLVSWVYFLQRTVRRQTAEITRFHDTLLRQATIDSLTGISNRLHWHERAAKEFAKSTRRETPLCALMIDIDDFKAINDTRGHDEGDRVLEWTAAKIVESLRNYDLPGRYGGEEFVVLLPDTGASQAVAIAQRIRASIESGARAQEGKPVTITVSVGVAELVPADATLDMLVRRADSAMYEAKRQGKNRVALRADTAPPA